MKLSELLEVAATKAKEQEDLIESLVTRCDNLEYKATILEGKNKHIPS